MRGGEVTSDAIHALHISCELLQMNTAWHRESWMPGKPDFGWELTFFTVTVDRMYSMCKRSRGAESNPYDVSQTRRAPLRHPISQILLLAIIESELLLYIPFMSSHSLLVSTLSRALLILSTLFCSLYVTLSCVGMCCPVCVLYGWSEGWRSRVYTHILHRDQRAL